jgi:hypothetical protein
MYWTCLTTSFSPLQSAEEPLGDALAPCLEPQLRSELDDARMGSALLAENQAVENEMNSAWRET